MFHIAENEGEVMSRAVKDGLIMAGAAGSVVLLVAGAEASMPVLAGAGAALALGATVAKLFGASARNNQNSNGSSGPVATKQ
jgi:hypothetical protein